MTVITTPLELAEDAILAALAGLSPTGSPTEPAIPAAWGVLPADTVRGMALAASDPAYVPYAYVAQHQDGGGRPDSRIHDAAWLGLVVVRCLSRDDGRARAGYARAVAALAALTAPAGYALRARYDRPIAIPVADKVYTRAAQWVVSIRRTA